MAGGRFSCSELRDYPDTPPLVNSKDGVVLQHYENLAIYKKTGRSN